MLDFIHNNCLDIFDRIEGTNLMQKLNFKYNGGLCKVTLEKDDVCGVGDIFTASYILHEVKRERCCSSLTIFGEISIFMLYIYYYEYV